MGQDLRDLRPGDAVLFGAHQVVLEGGVHQALGHQRGHRDQGAVPEGQLRLAAPHLAEQHVVIELREFGGELSQRIPSRGLFDRHRSYLSFK